jgi:glutamate-ammonia-ligase adenylyltransferase
VEGARQVADIYRHWRKLQHMIRLQGVDRAQIDADLAADEAGIAIQLWTGLFD